LQTNVNAQQVSISHGCHRCCGFVSGALSLLLVLLSSAPPMPHRSLLCIGPEWCSEWTENAMHVIPVHPTRRIIHAQKKQTGGQHSYNAISSGLETNSLSVHTPASSAAIRNCCPFLLARQSPETGAATTLGTFRETKAQCTVCLLPVHSLEVEGGGFSSSNKDQLKQWTTSFKEQCQRRNSRSSKE
jgi:hypothetical protein